MENMLSRVAELDRKGWSQVAISKEVGVSQSMVHKYLKKLKARLRARADHDVATKVMVQVQGLRDVMRAAWEAYQLSKEDAVEVIETKEFQDALDAVMDLEDDGEGGVKPKKKKGGRKKTAKETLEKAVLVLTKVVTSRKGRLPANEYLTQVRQCLHQIAELEGLYPDPESKGNQGGGEVDWSIWSKPKDQIGTDSVDRKLEQMVGALEEVPQDAEFTVRDEGVNGSSNGTH